MGGMGAMWEISPLQQHQDLKKVRRAARQAAIITHLDVWQRRFGNFLICGLEQRLDGCFSLHLGRFCNIFGWGVYYESRRGTGWKGGRGSRRGRVGAEKCRCNSAARARAIEAVCPVGGG